MKKLSQILETPALNYETGAVEPKVVVAAVIPEPAPVQTLERFREKLELTEAEVTELDPIGAGLVHLEGIMSMSDDMINTLGELEHIDEAVIHEIASVHQHLEHVFGALDVAVGINPTDFRWAEYSDPITDYHIFDSSVSHGVELTTEDVDNRTINPVRFKQLADLGLVSSEESIAIVKSLKNLAGGKPLTSDQRVLVNATFLKLVALITGDTSVFGKISSTIRKKSLGEEVGRVNG